MLGLAAIPSIVMLFGCLVLPESPSWLLSKGFSQEAKKVLVKLRGTDDVNDELLKKMNHFTKLVSGIDSGNIVA